MVTLTGWVFALTALAIIIAASGALGVYYAKRPHLLFLILLVSFGVLFVQFYVLHVDMLEQSEQVEGSVVATGWDVGATSEDGEPMYYDVTLEYRYEYDGQEYTSDNIAIRTASNRVLTESRARSLASEYEAGDSINVWVYPKEPSRSYIKPSHFLRAEPFTDALTTALYFWWGGWLLTAGEHILPAVIGPFVRRRLEVAE